MDYQYGVYGVATIIPITNLHRGTRGNPPPGGGRHRRQPLGTGRGRHWGRVGAVQSVLSGQSQPGELLPYRGLLEPGHLPAAALGGLRLCEGAWLMCGRHHTSLRRGEHLILSLFYLSFQVQQ